MVKSHLCVFAESTYKALHVQSSDSYVGHVYVLYQLTAIVIESKQAKARGNNWKEWQLYTSSISFHQLPFLFFHFSRQKSTALGLYINKLKN